MGYLVACGVLVHLSTPLLAGVSVVFMLQHSKSWAREVPVYSQLVLGWVGGGIREGCSVRGRSWPCSWHTCDPPPPPGEIPDVPGCVSTSSSVVGAAGSCLCQCAPLLGDGARNGNSVEPLGRRVGESNRHSREHDDFFVLAWLSDLARLLVYDAGHVVAPKLLPRFCFRQGLPADELRAYPGFIIWVHPTETQSRHRRKQRLQRFTVYLFLVHVPPLSIAFRRRCTHSLFFHPPFSRHCLRPKPEPCFSERRY